MSSIFQRQLDSNSTKCLTPELNIFLTTGNHTIMCLEPDDGCLEPDDGCSGHDDGDGSFTEEFFKQFFDGIHEK